MKLFEHIKDNQFKLITESHSLKETFDPMPPGWGLISKKEEEAAFQVIKRKWVPKAVEMWNKTHRIHKVSAEEVLKNLKKIRHDSKQVPDDIVKYNRSDIIHYQYKMPNVRDHSITFMIHRWLNPRYRTGVKDGSLMAGYFSGAALFEEPVNI